MIYFTSDLHLFHSQSFLWEPRGYSNAEEHVEGIISSWNSVVNPEDEVYILGDLMLNDTDAGIEAFNRLNGKKYIIIGNHDTDTRVERYKNELLNTEVIGFGARFKYRKYGFYLSHYPTLVSNFDAEEPLRKQVINLCGHSHTKDKFFDMDKGLIYHVEWDAHGKPISIDEIIEDLKNFKENL